MAFDKDGFFKAVAEDDILGISLYVHAGANLDFKDVLGRTALHVAVEHGHLETITMLIDSGASPYVCNIHGDNCLTLAIHLYEEPDVTKHLLEIGVDPNRENDKGILPIQEAIIYNKGEHIKVLADHGANLFIPSSARSAAFDMLMEMQDIYGIEFVDRLMTNVDCNTRDAEGDTILHKLVSVHPSKTLIHWMLKKGADPNLRNNEGNTPLHVAVSHTNSQSLMPLLLGYGADPYIKNNAGHNVFHILKVAQEFGLLSLLRDYAKRHNLKERHKQRQFGSKGG